jgi:hypothetical protein
VPPSTQCQPGKHDGHTPEGEQAGCHEQDRDEGDSQEGERRSGADEYRDRQAAQPLVRGPITGQIVDQWVQLAIGAGAERGTQALFELMGEQTPLGGGLSKPLGNLLAISVRGSKLCVPCHWAGDYRSRDGSVNALTSI